MSVTAELPGSEPAGGLQDNLGLETLFPVWSAQLRAIYLSRLKSCPENVQMKRICKLLLDKKQQGTSWDFELSRLAGCVQGAWFSEAAAKLVPSCLPPLMPDVVVVRTASCRKQRSQ